MDDYLSEILHEAADGKTEVGKLYQMAKEQGYDNVEVSYALTSLVFAGRLFYNLEFDGVFPTRIPLDNDG